VKPVAIYLNKSIQKGIDNVNGWITRIPGNAEWLEDGS